MILTLTDLHYDTICDITETFNYYAFGDNFIIKNIKETINHLFNISLDLEYCILEFSDNKITIKSKQTKEQYTLTLETKEKQWIFTNFTNR